MKSEAEAAIKILSTKEFSLIVEAKVSKTGCTYMDAVVDYCAKEGAEVETMAKLINTKIKALIQVEAEDLNYLPKTQRLPI